MKEIKFTDWSFPYKKEPCELENSNVKPPNYRDKSPPKPPVEYLFKKIKFKL